MNYYFEREVRHLEYVQQRKLIRDQEKKEMALELVKKKTVSEISERRDASASSPWESVARLTPQESCALHSFLLSLMRTKRTFLWFPRPLRVTVTCQAHHEILPHFYLFIACGCVLYVAVRLQTTYIPQRALYIVSALSCKSRGKNSGHQAGQ